MQKGSIKMFVSDNLDVNKAGNLTIGGVDTVALARSTAHRCMSWMKI